MRKLTAALVALLLLTLGGRTTVAETKPVEVTQLHFMNGEQYDGQVPANLEPLAKAVRADYPNATFKVDRGTLLVGLKLDGVQKGEVLKVVWQSDCPVNSQYNLQAPKTIISKLRKVRPVLVAWTQIRHTHLGLATAGVSTYRENETSAEVILAAN